MLIARMFILRQREREHVCKNVHVGEVQRERGRERIPSRLYTVSKEPDAGLDPTNPEIVT